MSYVFAAEEIAEITILKDQAKAGAIAWGDVYEKVADILTIRIDEGVIPEAELQQVEAAKLWFQGAALVNRDESGFSTLIREYTRRQLQLHFGEEEGNALADSLMQDASDNVARAAIENDLLVNGVLPSVEQLAAHDATQVGETLFSQDSDDSAAQDNAAWSGTTLFSLFGQDETGRLLKTGGTSMDTVEDLRNVLFAIDAFNFAAEQADDLDVLFEGGVSVGFSAFFPDAGSFLNDYWPVASSVAEGIFADNWDALLQFITDGSEADSAINFAIQQDRYQLIDKLADLVGVEIPGTSESNFLDNAYTLFSTMENSGQLDLTLAPLDDMAVSDISDLAMSDASEGLAYRYALMNLNPFVVTGDASLYDPHNQAGELSLDNLSDSYLADRALMLSAIIQRNEADTKHPERIDGDAILFNDADIGTVFAGANAAGQGGTNTLSADDVTNIVFGNNQDDGLLIGHDNNDRFEGAFHYPWNREAA